MKVPGKFPEGTKLHEDKSSNTWVEYPDGRVYRFNEESNELMERDALPIGSLIGSMTEEMFFKFAEIAEE